MGTHARFSRPLALRGRLPLLVQDESGSALVEFSLLAPMLIVMWVGVLQFGPVLQKKIVLQTAVHAGAQEIASDRTDPLPYTHTINKVQAAAGSFYTGSTVTVSVCNATAGACVACASDSACASSLQSAKGYAAQVAISQPCTLAYTLLSVGASCSVTASESALIQ